MITCWILVGALGALALLHVLFEAHYFLRMFVTVFLARFCRGRVHVLEETSVYGE